MMAICADGPLHICAPMVPGLPPPGKAHAAQGGKITTPGARHRTKGATDPLDATPSGHAGESELFGAAQGGGFASASLLIQDRNNRGGMVQLWSARYYGLLCKRPCAQMCTNDTRAAVAG